MKTRLLVLILMGLSITLLSQSAIAPINVNILQPACVAAGIHESNLSAQFKIYPNPFKETLKIESTKNNSENLTSVIITNILGTIVMESRNANQKNEQTFEIDLDRLEAGFYIIILQSENNILVKQKIVKQ